MHLEVTAKVVHAEIEAGTATVTRLLEDVEIGERIRDGESALLAMRARGADFWSRTFYHHITELSLWLSMLGGRDRHGSLLSSLWAQPHGRMRLVGCSAARLVAQIRVVNVARVIGLVLSRSIVHGRFVRVVKAQSELVIKCAHCRCSWTAKLKRGNWWQLNEVQLSK
jgi:hypothetical protein